MHVQISKTELADALSIVSRVVSRSSVIPAANGFLIKASENNFSLTGTDLKTTVTVLLRNVNIHSEGSFVTPFRFYDAVKSIGETFSLKIQQVKGKQNTLKLTDEKENISVQFLVLPADTFPKIYYGDKTAEFKIEIEILRDILGKTLFAVNKKSVQAFLEGVRFLSEDGQLKCFAVDGYRAAFYCLRDFKGDPFDIIIPASALSLLQQFARKGSSLKCYIYENVVVFEYNDDAHSITCTANLLSGKFPPIETMIRSKEENTTSVKVDKSLFLQSLQRVSLTQNFLKLKIQDNMIQVFSEAQDDMFTVSEKIAAETSGKPLSILFNPHYLLEPLEAIKESETEDGRVELGFRTDISSCQLEIDDMKRRYVYFALPLSKGEKNEKEEK